MSKSFAACPPGCTAGDRAAAACVAARILASRLAGCSRGKSAVGCFASAPGRRIMPDKFDYDIIVIGSGIAGYCSALSALEQRARVVMIEAAPKVGGSSQLSSGMVMGAGTRFQRA